MRPCRLGIGTQYTYNKNYWRGVRNVVKEKKMLFNTVFTSRSFCMLLYNIYVYTLQPDMCERREKRHCSEGLETVTFYKLI